MRIVTTCLLLAGLVGSNLTPVPLEAGREPQDELARGFDKSIIEELVTDNDQISALLKTGEDRDLVVRVLTQPSLVKDDQVTVWLAANRYDDLTKKWVIDKLSKPDQIIDVLDHIDEVVQAAGWARSTSVPSIPRQLLNPWMSTLAASGETDKEKIRRLESELASLKTQYQLLQQASVAVEAEVSRTHGIAGLARRVLLSLLQAPKEKIPLSKAAHQVFLELDVLTEGKDPAYRLKELVADLQIHLDK